MADGNSLEQQAQSGNMDAQFQLGVQYLYGTNVDKDTSKAAEWFTKAAAQGHVPRGRGAAQQGPPRQANADGAIGHSGHDPPHMGGMRCSTDSASSPRT